MTQGIKENITYGSAIGMLMFGVVLTTAGFIIDPQGQIHDSVLYVLGQCLIFAGSVMGVSAYATGRMRHIEDSVKRDIDHRFRAYERGCEDGKKPHRDEDGEEEPTEEEVSDEVE